MNNEELLENKIQQFLKCADIINKEYDVSSSYTKVEACADKTSYHRYMTIAFHDRVFVLRFKITNTYLPFLVKDYCEILIQLFGKNIIPEDIKCFELVK